VIDSWANSNNVDIGGGKFKGLLVGGVGVGGLIVGEVVCDAPVPGTTSNTPARRRPHDRAQRLWHFVDQLELGCFDKRGHSFVWLRHAY
jgi:hypothetical protein